MRHLTSGQSRQTDIADRTLVKARMDGVKLDPKLTQFERRRTMKGLGRRVLALVCLVLVLVPAYVDTEAGVSAQATGATFITTDDNENNDHTGAPDNDMHSANPECLFNDNPVTPIEFNIVAASLPSFTTAQLSLYAWDVDEQGEVGYEPEVDEVYFNGHLVGTLTGWNDTWSTSVFQLSPSWVRQGNNLVEVRINKHYPNDHDTWCTAIDWGQLVLDRGGGEAFIKETSLDRECYIPGQTVGIFVEVDTTAASQEVEVEINILDPNGVTRAATSRRFTTYDADVDSFVEPLTLPTDAPTGPYTAQVIVYDAASMAQQDIWIGHFVVDPNCGTITPVITDTPTARPTATHTATPRPTGTSTPTATHTATPRPTGTGTPTTTPTYQPPPPPCSVTCDKSASPSTVGPGEEVVVTISLTGSNGACRVTHQNADVMLVIDKSGSMNDDTQAGGPEQPITDAKNAAKEFVDKMDLTRDQVGVVAFDSSARKAHDLSNNAGTVRTAIDGLSAGGGTDIAAGIRAAQAELSSSRHNAANAPVIVLLSDGKSDEAAARSAAEEAKRAGTRIFTIGLGAGVNPATMQAIASSPSDYYYAATGAELAAIYEQVAGAIQGRPGTNITITDVLGPGMTLVPNSFTGSPAPTVSGNTLTWKVASLGFETKTWSYRVKAPSTPGTYPVNSSAQVTYTDSNGNPAQTSCPGPQITVVPGTEQIAEIYTKDNPPDDGSVPSSEPWWESPDIWVRHQADGSGQHQNPQFGQTNYVYVRVRNIGNTDVTNITVHVYGAKAAAAFRWPQDWTPEIGSASIANLAAGQTTTVYVPWQPPQSGHYCFLTRIEAAQDPITHDGWVKFDNNISQKNVHVLDLERGPLDSSVILVNPQRQPAYVSLFIGSTDFPAGGAVTLEFADPGLFQRWQDAGGDLVGAELIPGTTSVSIRPHSELQATIARIPMSAGEQSHINLRVEGPAGSKPIVRVTEKIEGEEIGGNIYQPPLIALLGDGNGDGYCTEIDALMALRMAVNTLSEDLNLDVDQDGQVSERDALTILTWAVRDGQCG